jgi:hypothetical protein
MTIGAGAQDRGHRLTQIYTDKGCSNSNLKVASFFPIESTQQLARFAGKFGRIDPRMRGNREGSADRLGSDEPLKYHLLNFA